MISMISMISSISIIFDIAFDIDIDIITNYHFNIELNYFKTKNLT